MATLARDLRKELEKTVKRARRAAETGARKVLEQLGVHHHQPYGSMTSEERALRNRLRAHGRQLGDRRDRRKGTQTIDRLIQECAYEHWHRMLFARFLAETDLLIEPQSGVAITLEECQELAREEGADWLELASDYAERMLPQLFHSEDPVLTVTLPPETRSDLEDLLKSLSRDVFAADDSLGWVYQFWQAEKKEEVNRSEIKIGADELPAVTQLFTEDYMVLFLLHNTLGAWWAGKVLADNPALASSARSENELRAACKVGDFEWTYLRFVRDKGDDGAEGPWRPAAGTFEGWPKSAKDLTVLDPCMGSGHFLVFALPILAAIRMDEEGLSETAAVDAVLSENLFGLEIDPRCTQLAAFNLAFAAWRRTEFHTLPVLNLACSGLAIGVTKAEWLKLAEKVVMEADPYARRDLLGVEDTLFTYRVEERVKNGLDSLYNLFVMAPWLGSLIDPHQTNREIFRKGFDELKPLLEAVLKAADSEDTQEMAVAAQGLAKTASILAAPFTLVVTNVPYLGIRKQAPQLRNFLEKEYRAARHDLATSFVDRLGRITGTGSSVAVVIPQTFQLMSSYKAFRIRLLKEKAWRLIVNLGPGSFETISGEVVRPSLFVFDKTFSVQEKGTFSGFDVSEHKRLEAKAYGLVSDIAVELSQSRQLENPDSRVIIETPSDLSLLSDFCKSLAGIQNGDSPKFLRLFWEIRDHGNRWAFMQRAVKSTADFGGMDTIIDYDLENGHLRAEANWRRDSLHDSDQRGKSFWGKKGILVSRMADLPATRYFGNLYDQASAAIVPDNEEDFPAIWMFCSSSDYRKEIKKVDSRLGVTSSILVKIPFDRDFWRVKATETHGGSLPVPFSTNPSQWIFTGEPQLTDDPLQVAVARLLGYVWPRQDGRSFPDCSAIDLDSLVDHSDKDGVVCISALKGEIRAEHRLNTLLAEAFGVDWSASHLSSLLLNVGFSGMSLDEWLRDGFFEQHCALFKQRPFIWHIWDGRRDGFHALVNYHRLAAPDGEGRRTLEKLIYSYLGDWIDRQRADQKAGVEGADARLAHAEHLRLELIKILEGEPPYDIFVRWKPLHQQPIGWEPDINDGVRLNVRPFMTARPLGARAKNACILRSPPNIKWQKDRGKEPMRAKEEYPWFWGWDEATPDFAGGAEFDGNRWNDLHYSNAVKQAARDRQGAKLEGKA